MGLFLGRKKFASHHLKNWEAWTLPKTWNMTSLQLDRLTNER